MEDKKHLTPEEILKIYNKQPLIFMKSIKTYKAWQKSNVNLSEYLGQEPCEIDEELYLYLAEVTAATYSSPDFIQTGEASFSKNGTLHYSTCSFIGDKHFYLGDLPEFQD